MAVDKNLGTGDVIEMYVQKTRDAITKLDEFIAAVNEKAVSEVYCCDSRDLSFIDTNSVDLVVTSPPYPNVYDYYLYHKQRMNCLGMDHRMARDNEIGSRLRYSSLKEDIRTFYDDMYDCFSELRRIVKPGKTIVILLGDSIVQGQLVNGFDIITDVRKKIGLSVASHSVYSLDDISRTFGRGFRTRGKMEHLVVMKNGA